MPKILPFFLFFCITLLSCQNNQPVKIVDTISNATLIPIENDLLTLEQQDIQKGPRPKVIQITKLPM